MVFGMRIAKLLAELCAECLLKRRWTPIEALFEESFSVKHGAV